MKFDLPSFFLCKFSLIQGKALEHSGLKLLEKVILERHARPSSSRPKYRETACHILQNPDKTRPFQICTMN